MSSTMTNAQAQTVDTRIGKLSFEQGLPTEDTVTELFDTFDFQRACEAYVWGILLRESCRRPELGPAPYRYVTLSTVDSRHTARGLAQPENHNVDYTE